MTLTSIATNLNTGFYYQFKVMSVNIMGNSDVSPACAPIITALIPGIPLNLTLQSRSANTMTFTWIAPPDDGGIELTGYNVYVALNDAVLT